MGFEFPLDVDYFGHPKVLKLRALLGRAEAEVYPLRLWAWACRYAKDGRLPQDPLAIEAAVGWRGRPHRLVSALCEALFIEKDTFTLHDWMDGTGHQIAIYERKKQKQREKRAECAGIVPEQFPERFTEKRREEKRRDTTARSDAPADADASPAVVPGPAEVAPVREVPEVPGDLKALPLYAADQKLCSRWRDLLPAWRAAYPGVDVLEQVRRAHSWELANRTRRKIDKARFLNGWLSRAQDAAPPPFKAAEAPRGDPSCPRCKGSGRGDYAQGSGRWGTCECVKRGVAGGA